MVTHSDLTKSSAHCRCPVDQRLNFMSEVYGSLPSCPRLFQVFVLLLLGWLRLRPPTLP